MILFNNYSSVSISKPPSLILQLIKNNMTTLVVMVRSISSQALFLILHLTFQKSNAEAVKSLPSQQSLRSRRSKLSGDDLEHHDNESSDDDGDKSNLWLRSLLVRSSLNEQHRNTSNVFQEVGSPTTNRRRAPSPLVIHPPPIVVSHTVVKEAPTTQTIHSQMLQVRTFAE